VPLASSPPLPPRADPARRDRGHLLANIDHATILAAAFVLAELEEALIVSMLCNFEHNLRDPLEQEVLEAGSWQVKRVEDYSRPGGCSKADKRIRP
jgi:hypothetical protein